MAGDLRVQLVRSGGFAGLTETRDVDASTLQAPVAGRLRELLEATNGSNGSARSNGSGRGRAQGMDRYQYEIRVEDSRKVRQLCLAEGQMSPSERELVTLLLSCGTPQSPPR